jgi:HSP20 family protein
MSIELENRVLSISGEKKERHSEQDEEARYHLVERNFGSFRRSLTLPATVDGSGCAIRARCRITRATRPSVRRATPHC